jgi:hypothetical protein
MAMVKFLRITKERVQVTFDRRDTSPEAWAEWEGATRLFQRAYVDLYEPGEDTHAAEIRAGDATATEIAVRFLELDPQCFRSGYEKERLLRALKSAPLTDSQVERLRAAMMHALDAGARRELGDWCRLAPRLDIHRIRTLLSARLESREPDVQRRARWVADDLERRVSRTT